MKISNLKFFNSEGYSIPTYFSHKIKFTVNGINRFKLGWQELPEGYIDIDSSGYIIDVSVLKKGRSYSLPENNKLTKEGYNDLLLSDFIKDIEVSVPDGSIFHIDKKYFDISLGIQKEFYSDNIDTSIEFNYTNSIELSHDASAPSILIDTIPDIANLYPSTTFKSSIYLEPVSTGLVSTETIFIMESRNSMAGRPGIYRPESMYDGLRLEFPSVDTSTFFIKNYTLYKEEDAIDDKNISIDEMDNSKIYWSRYTTFTLSDDFDTSSGMPVVINGITYTEPAYTADENTPLALTIGFKNNTEGCFEDNMVIYNIDLTQNTVNPVIIGIFSIKSQTIGEDERYRTLLGNFGIPDPKYYPNLFKESDILENGIDYSLVNKKSKELFLTYHEIFPYAGTYKALINAIKFLGYDDIYFKEWYQYFDASTTQKVAFQKMDIETSANLSQKLKRYNVTLSDFMKWKKLNRLSMIYKINKEENTEEIVDGKFSYISDVNGNTIVSKSKVFENIIMKNDYVYYSNEVLAKLQSLKTWLENYIIGLNCHITDITGEGIYFEKLNENIYSTGNYTFSNVIEHSLSPYFVENDSSLQLIDSSAVIAVSLKEFNNNMTFNDLKNQTAFDFIKYIESPNGNDLMDCIDYKETYGMDGNIDSIDNNFLIYGSDAESPVIFNDIAYELSMDTSCGTLSTTLSHPFLVMDNGIYIFGNFDETVFGCDYDLNINNRLLPTIRIAKGSLRQVFGKWKDNVKYNISSEQTVNGWEFYIQNTDDNTKIAYSKDYITLKPNKNASFKYTKNNKYGAHLFILKNYRLSNYKNDDYFINQDIPYIIEIHDGFFEVPEESNTENTECVARVNFSSIGEDFQKIFITYIYKTDRMPVYGIEGADKITDYINEYNDVKAKYQNLENDKYTEYLKDTMSATDNIKNIFTGKINTNENKIQNYNDAIDNFKDIINTLKNSSNNEYTIKMYQNTIERYLKYIDAVNQKIYYLKDEEDKEILHIRNHQKNVYYIESSNLKKNECHELQYLKEKYFTIGNILKLKINHIGDYTISAKAWDNYNVPFVNKSSAKESVWGACPDINALREIAYSTNDLSVNIIPVDNYAQISSNIMEPEFLSDDKKIVSSIDGSGALIYNNISYAGKHPQENDYIKLCNVTEKVDDISIIEDTSTVNIILCDENFGNQNLFFADCSIMLYFTNPDTHVLANNDYHTVGPLRIMDYNKIPPIDISENDNNYIIAEYNKTVLEEENNINDISLMVDYKSKNYECYAANVSEFEIKYNQVQNNTDDKTAFITINTPDRDPIFNEGSLVKINFFKSVIINTDTKDNEEYVCGNTYRIIDVDITEGRQIYHINGLINKNLFISGYYKNNIYNNYTDDFELKATISGAYLDFVNYITKTASGATDISNNIEKINLMNFWNERYFIDQTFSFHAYSFNPNTALKLWGYNDFSIDTSIFYEELSSECYINEPFFITSNDNANSFTDFSIKGINSLNYMTIWDVFYSANSNTDETELFQITNESIPVKLTQNGNYRFTLTAIDKFGNRLSNDDGYHIFIK